jgi:tRNA threonylcarbamoyladenosine biosynthesis protein TsaB
MLTLAVSTSSGQFALVLGENNTVLFDSSEFLEHEKELDDALSAGLNYCKREVSEIGHIIVDIGPGGTSRVRTGIAFANALAYSLGIAVCPVSSMELAGIDAASKFGGLPVVNSIKSIKGNAYIGFYNQNLISIDYGTVNEIVPQLVKDIDRFVVVGFHREAIINLPDLKNKVIIDSAMSFGNAKIMIEKSDLFITNQHPFPAFAQPITEKTLIHHE